jgi:hypothetical protein
VLRVCQLILQSSFRVPVFELWKHNLNSVHQSLIYSTTNSVYQSYDYGITIFIPLTTSSFMVPKSSLHLPVFQLWYHNLHSTYHFVSYGTIIFCPCTSLSFVMEHSSFLVQRKTCRRDYSNNKATGRRKCKLFNGTRIFFYASGIYLCPKIFAQPTLLCYLQPCVIYTAAKWRSKRIVVQIENSSNC